MLKLDSEIDLALFFKWWGEQLSFLLPQKFRAALARGKSVIAVELKGTSASLSYINHQQETFLGEFEINDLGREEIQSLIESNSQYSDAKIVLRVPESVSVIQHVFLPAAAADNLQQVISYELDRYTPFNRDQVYFDFIKIGPANNKALIHLILILVQKSSLEAMYQQCLDIGLQPFYADSAAIIDVPDKVSSVYNLLPQSLCQKVSKKPLFIMLGSLLVMLVLLASLIYLPLKMTEDSLAILKNHVRKVEKVALEIEDSKKSIDYLYQATQTIIDKKNAAPSMIAVVNTVSEVLTDDTWVSNLRYYDNTLQLSGQSGSASNLIGSLEKTTLFTDTKFISPVTKDRRSGLERFKISTEVKHKTRNADTDTE